MRTLALMALGLLTACGQRPPARSHGTIVRHADVPGQHPNPRFEIREIAPTDTIWLEPDDHREDAGLRGLLTAPVGAAAVSFTGPNTSDDALGGVDAIASLPDGRLLVLDRKASIVRIVSAAGEQIGHIGRPGRGPGDFFHPRALAVDAASNVYVGDFLRRIQRFRPDGDSFALDTVLPVTASALGLCMLDSLLVVHGADLADPSVIRIYTTRGQLIRQFGATYRAPAPMLNWQYGQGRIACLPRERQIAYVAGAVPVLRIFTVDGRTIRLAVVADAHTTLVTEHVDGYEAATAPDGRLDQVLTLAALPGGRVLLQVGVSTTASRQRNDDFAQLISVALPPKAGGVIERTTSGNQVAGIVSDRPIFAVTEPTPGVTWASAR